MQHVKHMLIMLTKSLDRTSRSASFRHVSRRTGSMMCTVLYGVDDYNDCFEIYL